MATMQLDLSLGLVVAVALAIIALVLFVRSSKESKQPQARAEDAPAKPAAASAAGKPAAEAVPTPPAPEPMQNLIRMPGLDEEIAEVEITQVGAVPADVLAAIRGKLSGEISKPDIEEEGVDVSLEELVDEQAQEEDTGETALIIVSGVARSDRGLKRPCNEDAFLCFPEKNEPVYVVADGMGGHAAGDIASKTAVEVIEKAFASRTFEGLGKHGWPRRGEELVAAIEMANSTVWELSRTDPKYHSMGTTVVAVRFAAKKQRAYIAHVGDSRCYRIREGEISQLTEDHSLGNLMGVTGKAARHLARAVGIGETVAVDLTIDRPAPGDYYLICSDGLNKMIPDRDILKLFMDSSAGSLDERSQALVDEANRRGGRDNITVISILVESPFSAAKAAEQARKSDAPRDASA